MGDILREFLLTILDLFQQTSTTAAEVAAMTLAVVATSNREAVSITTNEVVDGSTTGVVDSCRIVAVQVSDLHHI